MDSENTVPSQLPLPGDYDEAEHQHSFNDFVAHAHHSGAYTHAPIDLRRDPPLNADITHPFAFTAANAPRFPLPPGGSAPDPSSFRPAYALGEGATSSLSPHTSSPDAEHSYTYATHPHNIGHLLHPNIQPPLYLPAAAHAVPRLPSVPEGLPLGMSSRTVRPHDSFLLPRDSGIYSHMSSGRPMPSGSAFGASPDVPRALHYPPAMASESGHCPHLGMQSRPTRQQSPSRASHDAEVFQFPLMEQERELRFQGMSVNATIHAFIEKGFFENKNNPMHEWTCYRRNYFALAGYFTLEPHPPPNDILYVDVNGQDERIVAFGMKLCAVIADGTGNGKSIELIQHTPKRDNGPKYRLEICKVSPSLNHEHPLASTFSTRDLTEPQALPHPHRGPYLARQMEPDPPPALASNSSQPHGLMAHPNGSSTSSTPSGLMSKHVFERIQFKQATANNGKRRASQQYFQLIVELYADVRKGNSAEAEWVRVGQRTSDKIVVRGRSPSHYQHENTGRSIGGSGGGSRAGSTGPHFPLAGSGSRAAAYGHLQSDGSRAAIHTGFGGHMAAATASYVSLPTYMTQDTGASVSPTDLSGGHLHSVPSRRATDGEHGAGTNGHYNYFGPSVYEGSSVQHTPRFIPPPPQLPPVPKFETAAPRRSTTDPSQYAGRHDYPDAGAASRWVHGSLETYHPAETSHGFFPDITRETPDVHAATSLGISPVHEEEEETHGFH